jgi:cyanophycinase
MLMLRTSHCPARMSVMHARSIVAFRSAALALLTVVAAACTGRAGAGPSSGVASARGTPSVGPANGTVMVVGGGAQGPETFAKLIELAGGPDALIVEVPTAGGDSVDLATVGRGLRAAGARNVVVYHTTSKAVADADTFVAKIANARGVWFGGGRHFRLVNSYAGTKSQRAFEAVLARGGVVGGSSAGASILGSYLVRGAPSNDNRIMNHPQYLVGFGYLRGVAIDQHVVARERLPDLHDSVTSKRPDLLGISEDEGTVWIVRGDTAEIMGRNKAFVYNGRDRNDGGRPFLTLHPGDRYNLAARRVMSRAIDGTPLSQKFVDDMFAPYRDASRGGATVLVAQDGKVLVNSAYGVPVQRRFTPETGMPNMPLKGLGGVLTAALTPDSSGRIGAASVRRVLTIGGMQRVAYDSTAKSWSGNVDDLYRFELGRANLRPGARDTATIVRGFRTDTTNGMRRHVAFGLEDGRRAAWVRYPERRATILILTNDDNADARAMAARIAEKLFGSSATSER